MSGREVLDRYFLEIRCKLLEVAASLDRMDRAGGMTGSSDERIAKIHQALEILKSPESNRAERLQMLFSRDYKNNWMADWFENTALDD